MTAKLSRTMVEVDGDHMMIMMRRFFELVGTDSVMCLCSAEPV